MNFGRGNFFDDNRRAFRSGFDDDDQFNRGFSNNFENLSRQRSPIFNNRDYQFDSHHQIPSNFPSFSNRNPNFGFSQQNQQNTNNDTSSQKVYHVPIRIEQDDDQSDPSYIRISEPNQSNQNNNQNNHQQQQHQQKQHQQNNYASNNYQSNTNEQTYGRPFSSSNRPSSQFYNQQNSSFNDFKDRAEQEFKRQNEEFKKNQGNEYKIPIKVEQEPNNLIRDFNNMHGPSSFRTSTPGQKNSTASTNEFYNSKDFNNIPSYNNQQQQHHQQFCQQQDNSHLNQQASSQQQQQTKKPTNPMSIIEEILEEVEKYEHEIDNFQGAYQDKQYRYLDEYLTRCMLKLDTIDTSSDANLKQSRKNALNYINKVIAKLERIEKTTEQKTETENKEIEEKMEQDQSNQDDLSKQTNESAKQDKSNEDESLKNDEAKKEDENKNETEKDGTQKNDTNKNDESKTNDKKDKAEKKEKSEDKKKNKNKKDGKDKDKKKVKKEDVADKKDKNN